MAFISIQNTLSTFLTIWHPFHVRGGQIPQSGINKIDVGIFYDVTMRVQGLRRKFYDVIPDRRIWRPGRENGVRKSKMCSKRFEQ